MNDTDKKCGEGDSNPHGGYPVASKTTASTNSAILALVNTRKRAASSVNAAAWQAAKAHDLMRQQQLNFEGVKRDMRAGGIEPPT